MKTEMTLEEKELFFEEQKNLQTLYKRKISDLYFSTGISLLNRLVGLDSKSQFSLGLFLKLGINFGVDYIEEEDAFFVPENLDYKNPDHVVELIVRNLKAYVINAELVKKAEVNMRFTYNTTEQLEMIEKALQENVGISFLTFVYLHEVQHILRKHNTSIFNEIMLKTAQSVDKDKFKKYEEIHKQANIAEDYCINNAIATLFEMSGGNFKKDIETISKYGMFDKKYEKDNEVDVLIKLLKQQPDVKVIKEDEYSMTLEVQEKDEDGKPQGAPKIITIPKQGKGAANIEEENENNKAVGSVADAIQNHIDSQKERGEGSFRLGEEIGPSIKTNIDWFDKLKSNLFTIVNRKTKQTLVNWSKLNSKYIHNHKSPTHKNIENTLDIILSVDNSGSMSNKSLQKLLYIIEQKKSKIATMTIIKHTDTITGVLMNEKDEQKILDFLGQRDNGGTSHKEVFQYLDNNIAKKDIDKAIFISFSDNYSDIENEYSKYKNIRNITKVWLNAEGKAVEHFIPGLKIDIF
jgi:hypothetical protein